MEPRHKKIRKVLLATVLANLILAFGKLFLGWKLNCQAIVADAIQSLLVAAAGIIALVNLYQVSYPPAESTRRYGKFELSATLVICGILLLACWEIISCAAQGLTQQQVTLPTFSFGGMLLLVAALGINYGLFRYQQLKADEWNSPVLAIDGAQFKMQIFTTLLTLLSLYSVKIGWRYFDEIATVLIVIIIGLIIYALIHESVNHLAYANRETTK